MKKILILLSFICFVYSQSKLYVAGGSSSNEHGFFAELNGNIIKEASIKNYNNDARAISSDSLYIYVGGSFAVNGWNNIAVYNKSDYQFVRTIAENGGGVYSLQADANFIYWGRESWSNQLKVYNKNNEQIANYPFEADGNGVYRALIDENNIYITGGSPYQTATHFRVMDKASRSIVAGYPLYRGFYLGANLLRQNKDYIAMHLSDLTNSNNNRLKLIKKSTKEEVASLAIPSLASMWMDESHIYIVIGRDLSRIKIQNLEFSNPDWKQTYSRIDANGVFENAMITFEGKLYIGNQRKLHTLDISGGKFDYIEQVEFPENYKIQAFHKEELSQPTEIWQKVYIRKPKKIRSSL
jgi:hypothetical protein